MTSSIVSIKLSDYAAQIYYSVDSTYKSLFETCYLYAAFNKFCYSFFDSAFKAEDSLNLMQPENTLREYLQKKDKETNYPLPKPEVLWGLMMSELVDIIKKKMSELKISIGGILISIPDGTDYSLYSLIKKACTFIKNEKKIKCEFTYNSIVASTAYLKCLINGIGNESKDIFSVKATCFIDFGFNSTECYVCLLSNLKSICLAKGRCKGGLNDTYQVIRKLLTAENELIPFDKWKSTEKADYKLIKESFSCYCNTKVRDVHFTNFKQDDILIDKNNLKEELDPICKDICDMVKKTIERAEGISKIKSEKINVGSQEFTLSNLKIDNFYINSEIKNQFLIEKLEEDQHLTFNDTNYGSTLFAIGCSLSAPLYQRKFNKKEFQVGDDINDLITIQEIVYPSRFLLIKDTNNPYLAFPNNCSSSEDMIEIGQLEPGDYKLFDNEFKKTDSFDDLKLLGIFNIPKEGCYYASLGNSIGIKPQELLYNINNVSVMEKPLVEEEKTKPEDYVYLIPKTENPSSGVVVFETSEKIIKPCIFVSDSLVQDEKKRFDRLRQDSDEFLKEGNKILSDALRYYKDYDITREEISRRVFSLKKLSNGDTVQFQKGWEELKARLEKKK
ncbi:hypothetical protein EDI_038470 [Entamoeba dispar SAW760]|uniref:Uncharacterized protein n=1 Tax=Entamoeba dispar (strain ATCC PRA-260 / SAW760) TaxID=370354 RepID=B0EKK6_ENTDS|nr:uncharacterized protein EDI_038470 [Entamoeba dispar SAW760]EDR24943.1 hypothetical protein EDI_038470 [Entamoeba dispar SAW760]|eukprot:EDR24943.1 hypothetical protein EDI_038470 [Entamoeba dispar SAW760]